MSALRNLTQSDRNSSFSATPTSSGGFLHSFRAYALIRRAFPVALNSGMTPSGASGEMSSLASGLLRRRASSDEIASSDRWLRTRPLRGLRPPASCEDELLSAALSSASRFSGEQEEEEEAGPASALERFAAFSAPFAGEDALDSTAAAVAVAAPA
eukprot:scaffold256_cov261-Pinguiococcus_pyrenoidosus.AAC.3